MADPSEPLVVTPQACPFVALDQDRDRRLSVPDPMHRCFAEATPKARSMGHQANFCLTPAFTGCPIFLDWASRAAADVTTGSVPGVASVASGGEAVPGGVSGPGTPEGDRATTTGSVATATAATATAATGAASRPVPAAVDRSATQIQAAVETPTSSVTSSWAAAPPWIAEAAPAPDMFDPPPKRTARVVIDPGPAAPAATSAATLTAPAADDHDGDAASAAAAAELAASMTRTDLVAGNGSSVAASPGAEGEPGPEEATDMPPWSRGRARVPVDAGAPGSLGPQTRPAARPSGPREWENARRFEAYAASRGSSRPGRPVLIAVGAILIAVAVLFVFLLPSMFLGGSASPTPTPAVSTQPGAAATRRPGATPTAPGATPARPQGTPRSYRVKRGDTLLRIGRRFNVTVDQLVCANDIRNPNSLSVGTTLVIPIESYQCPKPTKKPR